MKAYGINNHLETFSLDVSCINIDCFDITFNLLLGFSTRVQREAEVFEAR
jgi:hypothetical protein